jgi:hypothetical protein
VIVSDVRALGAGVRRSWREHGVMMVVVWSATTALCAWAAGSAGLYYFIDFRSGSGPHSGAMTVFSAFALVAAGVCTTLVARRVHAHAGWSVATLAWAIGGAGGLLLAVDELIEVHEGIARRLARAGVPAPFGVGDRDLYVFAIYALGALFAVRGALPQLRRWGETWLPGMAAVLCFVLSSAVDAVPWESMSHAQQSFWGPAEEILKTLGTVSFAVFALLLAEAAARDAGLASIDTERGDGAAGDDRLPGRHDPRIRLVRDRRAAAVLHEEAKERLP